MPYIKKTNRPKLQSVIKTLPTINTSGELNYLLTLVCMKYMDDKQEDYQAFNDIVGALECCKQEFYSRVVVPYEEEKIKENGDVF